MSDTKGYDDSPPRNGVIFFYTVLTVAVLVGVKFLLDSYFAVTMESELHAKVLSQGLEEVAQKKAQEREALEQAGLDRAMQLLAQRGRTAASAIAPASGQGKPQVGGWSQLARELPEQAPALDQPEAGETEGQKPGAEPAAQPAEAARTP